MTYPPGIYCALLVGHFSTLMQEICKLLGFLIEECKKQGQMDLYACCKSIDRIIWAEREGLGALTQRGKQQESAASLIVVLYKKMKPKKRKEVKDERENSIWSVEVQDKSTWGSWRNRAVKESEISCIYLNKLCWNSLVTYRSFLPVCMFSFSLHGLAMMQNIQA